MLVWDLCIIGLIVIICILCNTFKDDKKGIYAEDTYVQIRENKHIEDCISPEDIQYQISSETQHLIDTIEANKAIIKRTIEIADKEVNTAWLNSYEKIIRISTNLDDNLKYHEQKNLEQVKFQYYTSLHFRSMIAANITYKECKEIEHNLRQINNLLSSIKKNGNTTGIQKSQIISTKNTLKELREALYNRVHELNRKTEILRDKVGMECGERGRQWREERMRHHS